MLPHLRMNDVPLFGKGYFFDQSSGEMINIVPTSLESIYSRSTFFKSFFNFFDFFIRKKVGNYLSSILQFLQLVHYFFSSLLIGSVLSRTDICFVRGSTQSKINRTSSYVGNSVSDSLWQAYFLPLIFPLIRLSKQKQFCTLNSKLIFLVNTNKNFVYSIKIKHVFIPIPFFILDNIKILKNYRTNPLKDFNH